jgi:phage tail-like protein
MARSDPFRTFRFRVEFDQVQHGGFSRVKGIVRETKFESYREGGLNDHEHKLSSTTVYGNLTLERGLIDPFLWDWHQDVIDARVRRRTLTLVLQDEAGADQFRWVIEGAYPVKWAVSDFEAASTTLLVESVELVHHGIRRA